MYPKSPTAGAVDAVERVNKLHTNVMRHLIRFDKQIIVIIGSIAISSNSSINRPNKFIAPPPTHIECCVL